MEHTHHHHNHALEGEMEPMSHDDASMASMMMKMYIHFGLGDLLVFKGLVVDTNLKLCVACVVLFFAAILLELLNYLRGLSCRCELKPFGKKLSSSHEHQAEGYYCCYGFTGGNSRDVAHCEYEIMRPESPRHRLFQALVHILRSALSLGLMLVAMTYNACLIFAMLMGAGVGFYLFYRASSEARTICH